MIKYYLTSFIISAVCYPLTLSADTFPVKETPHLLSPLKEKELRGCFNFFGEEWIDDSESPTFGMTNGDYLGMNKYSPISIEEQGFYFTAIIIGVDRGWITRKEE